MKDHELSDALTPLWQTAIDDERCDDAIMIGIGGYLVSRENNNEDAPAVALTWIKVAIDRMFEKTREALIQSEQEQNLCSFCGRGEPEVRLAAGHTAQICNGCVADLADVFAEMPSGGAS